MKNMLFGLAISMLMTVALWGYAAYKNPSIVVILTSPSINLSASVNGLTFNIIQGELTGSGGRLAGGGILGISLTAKAFNYGSVIGVYMAYPAIIGSQFMVGLLLFIVENLRRKKNVPAFELITTHSCVSEEVDDNKIKNA